MSERKAIRRVVKEHPLDAYEIREMTNHILDTMMSDQRGAAVRRIGYRLDETIPKAGPCIAADVVMALGALLDEELDDVA